MLGFRKFIWPDKPCSSNPQRFQKRPVWIWCNPWWGCNVAS